MARVMKFGGSVLKDEKGFWAMNNILKENLDLPCLLVVSALSKVTSELRETAFIAMSGNELSAGKNLDGILNENLELGRMLLGKDYLEMLKTQLEEYGNKLKSILRGISITKELTPRTLDYLLSHGEYFSLATVNLFLKEKGFKVNLIDASEIIVSDENFGNAMPIYQISLRNCLEILIPTLAAGEITLTQGFVARTKSGQISTMGMESSNLTATFYASALGSDEVTFWTDVEGIRSADPKIADETKAIPAMSYKDAYKCSVLGLKLIYPQMIDFAEHNNIKLVFRSAFNPRSDSTEVGRFAVKYPLITYIDNLFHIEHISEYGLDSDAVINFVIKLYDRKQLPNYLALNGESINTLLLRDSAKVIQIATNDYGVNPQSLCLISFLNPPERDFLRNISKILPMSDIYEYKYSGSQNVFNILAESKYLSGLVRYLNDFII